MTEPVWLTLQDVLSIHKLQLEEFGGAKGVRDRNGVEAAVVRPQQHWHYSGGVSLAYLAALYVESIAGTQHFVDGNKRVGFHAALLFLRLNGLRLQADPYVAAQAVLDLVNREMTIDEMALWIHNHSVIDGPGHEEANV